MVDGTIGTHVTNACMCVLMLAMGTVLLTMLLKYYSTIPFVNRNTVTYLLTFIFCIIFGIIIIQVLPTSFKCTEIQCMTYLEHKHVHIQHLWGC